MDTTSHNPDNADSNSGWRWLRYVAWGGAAGLILLPLIAMQFAPGSGVDWGIGDFVFAILMIGGTGLVLEVVVRSTRNWTARGAAALALATGFLLIWSNLAVGYIGSEDNPYNMVFFLVVAIALVGSFLARFRVAGMAWAMTAAGVAHVIAGAIGYPQDPITGPITMVFTGMWLTAAGLFRFSARDGQ